jgi:hypothetical protein
MNKKTKYIRDKKNDLDDKQIKYFLTGSGWFEPPIIRDHEAHEWQAWQNCRERFADAWINARPGSRPAAWWKYDSPEPRRCITGDPVFPVWMQFSFGLPTVELPEKYQFESENDYLKRHNLLTPYEKGLPDDELIKNSVDDIFGPGDAVVEKVLAAL